jgi:hypothetical protein
MGLQIDPVAALTGLSREVRAWRSTITRRKAAPAADVVQHSEMLVGSMRIIERTFRQMVAPLVAYDPSDPEVPWPAICRDILAFAYADAVSPKVHEHVVALHKFQTGERRVPDGLPEDAPKTLARLGFQFLEAIQYAGPAGGRPTGWGTEGAEDLQWLLDTVASARAEDVPAVRERAQRAIKQRPRGALDQADHALSLIRAGWVDHYRLPLPERPQND